jgi:methyl-accepting chemotaxis protein
MSEEKSARGPLEILLPLSTVLFCGSWILFVIPTTGLPSSLATQLISAFGAAVSAVSWIAYRRSVRNPALKLREEGEAILGDLSALTNGLAKMSTGDLAARVPTSPERNGVGKAGELGRVAEILRLIGDAARDGTAGFDSITDEPCRRLCYVGSDSFAEGVACGEAVGRLTQGQGKIAVIVGDFRKVHFALRRKGLLSVLMERFPGVQVAETVETRESGTETYTRCLDILKRIPDLKAIYVAEGETPSFAAKAVVDSKREGRTVVVCHDLTDSTLEYLKRGIVAATVSQDPYAQGFDPVVHLYNHLVEGWEPVAPRLLTTLETVDPERYRRDLNAAASSGSGRASGRTGLAVPSAKSPGRGIKIAVLCLGGEGFWAPVRAGARDAGALLEKRNVLVEWMMPKAPPDGTSEIEVFSTALRDLAARKYDGIALPLFDRALVPVVNEIVASGIAVVAFNSEPTSLREMVSSVSVQAARLIALSQELAASATESGQSTERISATMERISSALRLEMGDVSKTGEDLGTLIANIGRVNQSAGESAQTARQVAKASREGFQTMAATREMVKSLESSAAVTDSSISALREAVERIESITATIGDIANQTNILAINASIEAARAGLQGKGFSVIAGEVRKLAEQSTKSADEIGGLITDIRRHVSKAAAETGRGVEEARRNVEVSERTEKSLTEIDSLARENERRMEVIFEAVEQMQTFSKKVEETVKALTVANRGSAGAADEITISTREMASQTVEVAKAARALSEMASAQQVLLSQFRLDSE